MSIDWFTPASEVAACYDKVRASFNAGKTLPLKFRLAQLYAITRFLDEHKPGLLDALMADGKCRAEAEVADLFATQKEAGAFLGQLEKWARPRSQSLEWLNTLAMDSCSVQPEPLGAVLVIGTWNYPLNTALSPLIGAIGAGNTAVLKLSEVAENVAKYVAEHLPAYLDPDCYAVVTGAVPETTQLLTFKWDHIFYTGNGQVGRVVARAAAEHLTTCTLELGGKSPTVIDRGVDMATTARRIAYGKYLNCGQTCIASDYVFVPAELLDEFVAQLKQEVTNFFGEDAVTSDSYGRIVSDRHWKRLETLLTSTRGKVVLGGDTQRATRYIAPTVVTGVTAADVLMQAEIFGPIMPVMTYESLDEVIDFVRARDKPLAAYFFSNDTANIKRFQASITAGGMVINDTIMQYVTPNVPFGGVGESGYGACHGQASFDVFSHLKPVLWRSNRIEVANKIRYAPYTERNMRLMELALVPSMRDPGPA